MEQALLLVFHRISYQLSPRGQACSPGSSLAYWSVHDDEM